MKLVSLTATGITEFYKAIKDAVPHIEQVFRDHNGFVAVYKGVEIRIQPALASKNSHDGFFFGNDNSFEGQLQLPEASDFGFDEPEQKQPETPTAVVEPTQEELPEPPQAEPTTETPAAVVDPVVPAAGQSESS